MIATTTLGIMKKSPKYRLSVLRTQGIFANDSVSAYVPHVLSQTLQTHQHNLQNKIRQTQILNFTHYLQKSP